MMPLDIIDPTRPVSILALDPGATHTGVCVLADNQIRLTTLWLLDGTLPEVCAVIRRRARALVRTHAIDRLVIEDYTWQGRHTTERVRQLRLLGALESLCEEVFVMEVAPREWMLAIVGSLGSGSNQWGTTTWKATIRQAVERQLRARGIGWLDAEKDPGGHRYDAIGLALYAHDLMRRR